MSRFLQATFASFLIFTLSASSDTEPDRIKVLFFGGGNAHEFKTDIEQCLQYLKEQKGYDVTYTEDIEQIAYGHLNQYDTLILHCCRNHPSNPGQTPDEFKQGLVRFTQEGGGIIFMHCAVASFWDWNDYIDLTGGIWVWEISQHDPYQMMKSRVIDTDHTVVRDLPSEFQFEDEFYHTLKLLPSSRVLIEGTHTKNGKDVSEPLVWIAKDTDTERTMTIIYGHDHVSWNHDVFRALLINSIEWTAFRR